jgi:iron complex outermembrane receptor protein
MWEDIDSGDTYGTEASARWEPVDFWRLTASYTYLRMQLEPLTNPNLSNPQQQFQIRSYLDLPYHVEFNSALYYTDQISPLSGGTPAVISAYFKLDLGLTWHPTKSLEIGIWGKNLLQGEHAEFGSQESTLITEIPRSVMGKITFRF